MPAAVVAIGAAWAGSTIAAAIGLTGFAAAVVGSVIAMGISAVGSSLLGLNNKPNAASSVGAESSTLLQNDASPIASIPIVYGKRRVGVSRAFIKVTDGNQYLHLVLAMAEGPIEAVEKIYFNGEVAWVRTSGQPGDVGEVSEKFASTADIHVHLGATDQAADSTLISRMGDSAVWGEDHRLRGVAYLYVRLKYDRNVYQGVPAFQADILGLKTRKLFDQASDLITHDYTYPGTTTVTSSATSPRVLYDYLTNDRYGKNIDPSLIDAGSFQDAQDYCDQRQLYYKDAEDVTQVVNEPLYTCDIGLDPDVAIFENIKKILSSMNAMLTFSGGLYRLVVNKAEEPVFAFNRDNIIGRWDISLPNKANRFNRMKVNWADEKQGYQPNITYVDSPTYLSADNNQIIETSIDLPGTTDYLRAYFTGLINLNQSRHTTVCSFTAAPTAFNVSVGEVVTITHEIPGWVDKKFRIMGMALLSDGTARVTATEYNDAVYTIGTEGNPVPYKADPATLDIGYSNTVPAPTNLQTSVEWIQDITGSAKGFINVSWDGPDVGVGIIAYYVVQYKVVEATNYTSVTVNGLNTKLGPLAAGYTYDIRVYAVNQFGARSAYLT